MPTICGMRRRGFTPEAMRRFAERDRRRQARERHRRRPARVLRARGPEQRAPRARWPSCARSRSSSRTTPRADRGDGRRQQPRGRRRPARARCRSRRVLYIEQDDFREDPPKKFFRLAPGREVRLRYAYFITCREVVKDAAGDVVELRCTYDPGHARRRRAGWPQSEGDDALGIGRPRHRRRGAALRSAVYGRGSRRGRRGLPGADEPARRWTSCAGASSSRHSPRAVAGDAIPVRALGYFCVDPGFAAPGAPVFNRTVTLKDTWARLEAGGRTG